MKKNKIKTSSPKLIIHRDERSLKLEDRIEGTLDNGREIKGVITGLENRYNDYTGVVKFYITVKLSENSVDEYATWHIATNHSIDCDKITELFLITKKYNKTIR